MTIGGGHEWTTSNTAVMTTQTAPYHVDCLWLGQAGFLFRDSAGGTQAAVDPYLSDALASDGRNLIRQFPAPIDTDELAPGVVLITHPHPDHLDLPTIALLAARPSPPPVVGSSAVISEVENLGYPKSALLELGPGRSVDVHGVRIRGVFVRHTDADPTKSEALGFSVNIGGLELLHLGDTEYDARIVASAPTRPDILFLPINGTGGNMDVLEAALLASKLQPALAIPMHYGMWPDDAYAYGTQWERLSLDPHEFVKGYERLSPGRATTLLTVGTWTRFERSPEGTVSSLDSRES